MAEPRREEIAPLFAEFGSACYQAYLLEDALRLLLQVGREYAKTQIPDAAILYPVDPDGIKTLGALFQEVRKVEVLNTQEHELIWKAIQIRNWLVHGGYWHKVREGRVPRFVTPEGRSEIIEELKQIGGALREATAIVHGMIDCYLAPYGLSMQQFMDQLPAMWESEIRLPGHQELIH
jgi:hypothetical protein